VIDSSGSGGSSRLASKQGDELEAFLSEVSDELRPLLQEAMDRVDEVPTLKEGVVSQVLGGGKRLRAALCASVCEMFCGDHRRALGFAAALEHLQNFTLVHDDIADGDPERRGEASAWTRYGLAHGINIGDIFVPLTALAILDAGYPAETTLRLVRHVSELGLQVAEGQALDINLRADPTPTYAGYVECTRRKTGAFFAMAALGGAVIGDAAEHHLAALREFAFEAGVAFQIRDDVIDVTGGKGRRVGSDIAEGKRTLLVVYSAEAAEDAERERLFAILDRPRAETTAGDVRWVIDLMSRTRARERSERAAETLIRAALGHLADLPDTPGKFRLIRLSRHLTRRLG
jgi:geranylgeranyl pyrophosphate synthase